MTDAALWALVIFGLLYVMLVGEWVHRAAAALAAALAVVFGGLLPPARAVAAVDWNTILLLFGLMVLVSLGEEVGLFPALASWVRQVTGPSPWGTILGFMIVVAVLSSVLPNLSVILILGPALFTAAEHLDMDPVPLLVFAIMASNLAGLATLVGDPPNILIGTAAGLSFTQFVTHLGPLALVLVLMVVGYARLALKAPDRPAARWHPTSIPHPRRGWALGVVLGATLVGFILQSDLGLPVGLIAVAGATLALLLVGGDVEHHLREVDWGTLVFFAGLFVVVGALVRAGVIRAAGTWLLAQHLGDGLPVALLVATAVCSAVLDNIPIVAAAIPLVSGIVAQDPQYGLTLWLALATGAAVGGNATLLGASANLVGVSLARTRGYALSFKTYLRWSLPLSGATLAVAVAWLWWQGSLTR